MTADELRDLCLSFMGTEETFPFSPGTSVFKVADMVEDSYDLVVSGLPKVRQRALLWRGAESA
jgi:predicted DNA-binding protein (MmcQ/YjbR family)